MTREIESLIIKYVNRNISVEEEQTLNNWLSNPHNEQGFSKYVQIHYAITVESMNEFYLKQSKEKLMRNEEEHPAVVLSTKKHSVSKSINIKTYLKYAAAAVIIGAVSTFVTLKETAPANEIKISSIKNDEIIQPGSNKAILTLENGSNVELKEDSPYEASGVQSTSSGIVYDSEDANQVEIQYNYLTIPRGGFFFVQLSDGTKVWLNSETQLKYPKSFISGIIREVELIYGEAYFDVSPSNLHAGSKFKVINTAQAVEVLGTEFNVKAYKDEDYVYTTLVEGLVNIQTSEVERKIKPKQQSIINKENKDMLIQYVDVGSEISWKNGVFSFKGKTLKEIMQTLSRWYDVNVVFEDKNLENLKFKGVINKNKNIEEILSIMKSNTINNYEIQNKTIILK